MSKNVSMIISPDDIEQLVADLKNGNTVLHVINNDDVGKMNDVKLRIIPHSDFNEHAIYVETPKPFVTDGCSGYMSKIWMFLFGTRTPWEECCEDHDIPYWRGGTKADRVETDEKLQECVKCKGYKILAVIMKYSVRIGGHPLLPTPWRWGYGYSYPRAYKKEK